MAQGQIRFTGSTPTRGANAAPPHRWFWDGQEHVDPAKEANAQATRLANNTTTLADEYARKGQDWEVQLRQRSKEVALMNQLGLAPTAPVAPGSVNTPSVPPAPPAGDNVDVEDLDEQPVGNE